MGEGRVLPSHLQVFSVRHLLNCCSISHCHQFSLLHVLSWDTESAITRSHKAVFLLSQVQCQKPDLKLGQTWVQASLLQQHRNRQWCWQEAPPSSSLPVAQAVARPSPHALSTSSGEECRKQWPCVPQQVSNLSCSFPHAVPSMIVRSSDGAGWVAL